MISSINLISLARAHARAGDMDKAISAFEEAVRLAQDNADAHSSLGAAYWLTGRHDMAMECYVNAVGANPDDPENYVVLAGIYGSFEMYEQAISHFNMALEIDPNIPEAHYGLGINYAEMNDTISAYKQYRLLKKLSPEWAWKLAEMLKGLTTRQEARSYRS